MFLGNVFKANNPMTWQKSSEIGSLFHDWVGKKKNHLFLYWSTLLLGFTWSMVIYFWGFFSIALWEHCTSTNLVSIDHYYVDVTRWLNIIKCPGHLRGGKFANGKFVNFLILPDISHAFSKKQYRTNYNFDSSRSKKIWRHWGFTNLPQIYEFATS